VTNTTLEAAILFGAACVLVGWVWSMVVARKVSTLWFVGIVFVFIFTLPIFAVKHWDRAKYPFIVTIIGYLVALVSVLMSPTK
jgi:hypothetical protein